MSHHWSGKELLQLAPPIAGVPEDRWKTRSGHFTEIQDTLADWDQRDGILNIRGNKKSMPLILARMDAESAALILELRKTGVGCTAIALDRLVMSGSLCLNSQKKKAEVKILSQECELNEPSKIFYSTPHASSLLKDVFLNPKDELNLAEKVHLWRWRSALRALEGLWSSTWIPGPPSALEDDPHERPRVLGLAESAGLRVPPWILTNCEVEAVRFSEKHQKVLFRETAFRSIQRNEKSFVVPVQAQTPRKIRQMMRACVFEQSPVMLQKLIPKDSDLRIVLTPKEVFAFRIESDLLDWRSSVLDSSITRFTLNPALIKSIRKLAKILGLQMACVDAVMKDREIFFLEVNRPGAWFFLEAVTGAPVAKSLARALSPLT